MGGFIERYFPSPFFRELNEVSFNIRFPYSYVVADQYWIEILKYALDFLHVELFFIDIFVGILPNRGVFFPLSLAYQLANFLVGAAWRVSAMNHRMFHLFDHIFVQVCLWFEIFSPIVGNISHIFVSN